ncbi:MAG TPA: HD domain-containing protein [Rhodothermales bacterium]|nr:HD domain-containing protein [Rhodothermales bacterium]
MAIRSRFKMFSDPVHGFVSVPKGLILDLVETPEVQRLRRIRQLGLGHMVFPNAEHNRFGHALGAMALIADALQHLSEKGTPVSKKEAEAAMITALLHDVGHGPFSHTLEHVLFADFHHEQMSRAVMADLNDRFSGRLQRALDIFDDCYERPFFHQLIASQLDMDRLDYLRRDSFFTGVAEGVVGVERIIKTMRVHPLEGGINALLMIERKGQYAVENYLIARRLMYWQVYLHKTVIAADIALKSVIEYARRLALKPASPAFAFFLGQRLSGKDVADPNVRRQFCALDDTDVEFSIKAWARDHDPILSDLADRFLNRRLLRVQFGEQPPSETILRKIRTRVIDWLTKTKRLSVTEAENVLPFYFEHTSVRVKGYGKVTDTIQVVDRYDRVMELSAVADNAIIRALAEPQEKWYIAFPKEVEVGDVWMS